MLNKITVQKEGHVMFLIFHKSILILIMLLYDITILMYIYIYISRNSTNHLFQLCNELHLFSYRSIPMPFFSLAKKIIILRSKRPFEGGWVIGVMNPIMLLLCTHSITHDGSMVADCIFAYTCIPLIFMFCM